MIELDKLILNLHEPLLLFRPNYDALLVRPNTLTSSEQRAWIVVVSALSLYSLFSTLFISLFSLSILSLYSLSLSLPVCSLSLSLFSLSLHPFNFSRFLPLHPCILYFTLHLFVLSLSFFYEGVGNLRVHSTFSLSSTRG